MRQLFGKTTSGIGQLVIVHPPLPDRAVAPLIVTLVGNHRARCWRRDCLRPLPAGPRCDFDRVDHWPRNSASSCAGCQSIQRRDRYPGSAQRSAKVSQAVQQRGAKGPPVSIRQRSGRRGYWAVRESPKFSEYIKSRIRNCRDRRTRPKVSRGSTMLAGIAIAVAPPYPIVRQGPVSGRQCSDLFDGSQQHKQRHPVSNKR